MWIETRKGEVFMAVKFKCPKCGQSNMEDSAFCVRCGSSIDINDVPQEDVIEKENKPVKNYMMPCVVIVVLILAICCIVVSVLLIRKKLDSKKNSKEGHKVSVTTETETEYETQEDLEVLYTDNELIEMARKYYYFNFGITPAYAEIESRKGYDVVVHLYDYKNGHITTYEKYTISAMTAIGSSSFTKNIDFTLISEEADSDDFIFADSNTRKLTEQELEGLSAADCRIAINEIFARHGRRFRDEYLQEYFDSKDWYIGTVEPDDFDESVFNEYEVANRDLLVQYEIQNGYR